MEYYPRQYYLYHRKQLPNTRDYNKSDLEQWYTLWFRRFASQNGPAVDWPATQLTGDDGGIPYNLRANPNTYRTIQKYGHCPVNNKNIKTNCWKKKKYNYYI